MQTVLTHLILLLTAFALQAQNNIKVTITGFNNNEGKAMVGLYDSEETFLKKEYKAIKTDIKSNQATVEFTNVPDGNYAISMFHDENENGELDMFMGFYPKEPYACSNNAKGMFGPPKWKYAVFTVTENTNKKIEINL